ncbi:hypothetical protein SEA_ZETA1847_53 [Microbacterium phage Zeta1847]|uniref:Uncharacterized protein n=1 Tax=Microbacterium phage Zeta1847 TaxID=2201444 RepID=A0A2Z4Q9K9_9CAUD|nr:hypothetical protein HOT46_gp53 [Microbacterium phage Zeta1847]AWY06687.1 hypothetical protein SEA_ZETA1847_53 [Microbacterium phage Zeta1847]
MADTNTRTPHTLLEEARNYTIRDAARTALLLEALVMLALDANVSAPEREPEAPTPDAPAPSTGSAKRPTSSRRKTTKPTPATNTDAT